MQLFIKSITDFVDWGFGFEIDSALKQLTEEPRNEVNTSKFNSNYRILQVCRQALFALSCITAAMLAERTIVKLFPTYFKRAGLLNRWMPTPLLFLIQVVSLIAWYQLKNFIQTNVYSTAVLSMLHQPHRFSGALWEVFKKQSYQISELDLVKTTAQNTPVDPLNDEEIKKLTEVCTNLKSLELKASGLSGQGLKSLAEHCPDLKELHLRQAKLDNKDYKQLSNFNSLNSLSIEDSGFGPEGMNGVVQIVPQLHFLSLDAPISKDDVALLNNLSSSIQDLRIYSPHVKAIDLLDFCKINIRNLNQVCCHEDDTVGNLQTALNNDANDGHWYRSSDAKGCKLHFEADSYDDDFLDDDI